LKKRMKEAAAKQNGFWSSLFKEGPPKGGWVVEPETKHQKRKKKKTLTAGQKKVGPRGGGDAPMIMGEPNLQQKGPGKKNEKRKKGGKGTPKDT